MQNLSPSNRWSQPPPLTPIVHKAMMSLGMNIAIIPDRGSDSGRSSGFNLFTETSRKLRHAYTDALKFLLLGFEFDFQTTFLNPGNSGVLERLRKMANSLPRVSSAAAHAQALNVYQRAIDEEDSVVRSDGEHMNATKEFKLSTNFQHLDWCNMIWSQLFATGASNAEIVGLFVRIVMIATQTRCPVQEFPSQSFGLGNIRTLDELHVMQLSAGIRERPDWRQKLQDEAIVSKWREEALNQDATPSMFDFLIAELHWLADELDPDTGIDHSTVPGVFYSDTLIPLVDRDRLRRGANMLAAVPENQQDWQNPQLRQVLYLVHPGLYPYVRGRTRRFLHAAAPSSVNAAPEMTSANMDAVAASILRFLHPPPPPPLISSPVAALQTAGKGVATSAYMTDADIVERKWQRKSNYQWLPVDVDISANLPHSVRFLSYINNLHPANGTPGGSLYPILERILSQFVPLFERTLTETRCRRTGEAGARTQFLRSSVREYWDPPSPTHNVPEGSEAEYFELFEDWEEDRKFIRPVVRPFVPPVPPGQAKVNLGGKTIQVIIKMANMHLTPENPEYAHGSWRLQGTHSERIVATGMYFYESENISGSSLNFRQAIEAPRRDKLLGIEHIEMLYGMTPGPYEGTSFTNQRLGSVYIPEGRCICFPNSTQHHFSSFKLTDPTKPGHTKILIFYLVDPSERVLSTSDVPPQQLEWLLYEVRRQVGTRLSELPAELFNLVCENVRAISYPSLGNDEESSSPWLMSFEEAKDHRLAIMADHVDFGI